MPDPSLISSPTFSFPKQCHTVLSTPIFSFLQKGSSFSTSFSCSELSSSIVNFVPLMHLSQFLTSFLIFSPFLYLFASYHLPSAIMSIRVDLWQIYLSLHDFHYTAAMTVFGEYLLCKHICSSDFFMFI